MIRTLRVEGRHLVDEAGQVVRLAGLSAFSLFKDYLEPNGWAAKVEPRLVEYRAQADEAGWQGEIVLRVFRHAASWNAFGITDPWSYSMDQIRDFTLRCAQRDFYLDWTGGDYQVCFPSTDPNAGELHGPRGIHEHHNRFTAALIGVPYIWNVSNEPFKNGLDPRNAPPPPWCAPVQYSGKYYDAEWDHATDLACINLHTDRGSEAGADKFVTKPHESAPFLWPHGKPIFYDEPIGADEENSPGRRSNNAAYFGILGQVLSCVSAVYFHSTDGLTCRPFRPITRVACVEFFKGAESARRVSGV